MLSLRVLALATLIAVLASPGVPFASAQGYPSRPIRVLTSVSPGGTGDIVLRALGEELHRRLGQPLIVEPRPGGGFIIAGRACAEAAPDAYTICMLTGETLSYNRFLYKQLPYDPDKDFAPITNLFFNTQALVVDAKLNVKSVEDLIALAKAKPKTLSYVAPSLPHQLFLEYLNREHGIDLVRVPFRGGSEATASILPGATPIAFFGLANFMSYLRDGSMTGLAVDGTDRSPLFRDIPTLAEFGYRDNLTRVYFGLVGPAALPRQIVERLRDTIADIVNEPGFRDKQLISRALEPIAGTPEEFARFLRVDRDLSRRVVELSGIKPQ
jgi:tripartite-type tricarboxylate transporter receptor subunit TctC